MHQIQEKLLNLAQEKDISTLGYRRIGRLIGVGHPQTVKYHLSQLYKNGYLTANKTSNIFRELKHVSETQPKIVEIPILGAANCGQATIFADEKIEGYIRVSTTLTHKTRGLYALRAEGDSMNMASISGTNIDDGDYVIVDYIDRNYKDGEYVVAIIDGCANIKRLKALKDTNQIALMSESKQRYDPIYIDSSDNFIITGKVKNVIKGLEIQQH